MITNTLSQDLLHKMDAYLRAANYLSAGQFYLVDNPLLRKPLELSHVKTLKLGQWGFTSVQNFIYVHLNRVIKKYNLDMIYVAGRAHRDASLMTNTYLEGTCTELNQDISQDETGMKKLFVQFTLPDGNSDCQDSTRDAGELEYSMSHAFRAVSGSSRLIAACIIGDRDVETGPSSAVWNSRENLNPLSDGAVLPILHLENYKIANQALLARYTHEELYQMFCGFGWIPYFVDGDEPENMHQNMANALEIAVLEIQKIQKEARENKNAKPPRWPMIILNPPRSWMEPEYIDGIQNDCTCQDNQTPRQADSRCAFQLKHLENWMKSFRPEELFDKSGHLLQELKGLAPKGKRRMGANPQAGKLNNKIAVWNYQKLIPESGYKRLNYAKQ